ncbi:FAD:protein FMN transferase [Antarctobacter sp.]|uniref:FAD:protein FMN transferase n=1 Tax=Antarctobacter sp. TaxID=1872577 RepID=UPI003A9197C1
MNRRRFLTVCAALAMPSAVSARTAEQQWTGRALGAQARITLRGPEAAVAQTLADCVALIRGIEQEMSLFDPASALVRLNREGVLRDPPDRLVRLLGTVGRIHRLTGGRFDPTVQPLWRALALGGDIDAARRAIGWDHVRVNAGHITLAQGQALTLNGIAQGFATDLVADLLKARGFETALVAVGEMRALGGPWRVGVSDPAQGVIGTVALTGGAVATSSPSALMLGDGGHILNPLASGRPLWTTVSVQADTATLADGLSTALVFGQTDEIRRIRAAMPGVRGVTLVDAEGNLRSV